MHQSALTRHVVAAWIVVGLLPGLLAGYTLGGATGTTRTVHAPAVAVSIRSVQALAGALGKPHDPPFAGTKLNAQLTNVTCDDWQFPADSNLIVFACAR